ncbi:MAG: serine protease [Actinobacteria bacterium]|nr:serine protease [Actinomycetota bacterium]
MSRNRNQRRLLLAAGVGSAVAFLAVGIEVAPASAIVGGSDTAIEELPWQISLQDIDGHICGGTVIDATHVVTAAHCTEGETASGLTVVAGVTDLDDSNSQRLPVTAIFSHPGYANGEAADISILQLGAPLTFGATVSSIAMASEADIDTATGAVVSGWGALGENDDGTTILQSTPIPLVDDASCEVLMEAAGSGIVPASELCAGGDGTDSCYGDSGGPLVVFDAAGVARLAGIVSWGTECGTATPGAYTEVPAFTDWMASVLAGGQAPDEVGPSADDEWIDDEWIDDEWVDDEWVDDEGGWEVWDETEINEYYESIWLD